MWARSSRATSAALLAAAAIGAAACEVDSGRECYPGDWLACTCGADRGYQQCDPEGAGYGACDCSGAIPGLAASAGAGSGGSGGAALLPFMSACDADAECQTGLCYTFAAKGDFCSQPCVDSAECPPPSTGCNMMGVCKAP